MQLKKIKLKKGYLFTKVSLAKRQLHNQLMACIVSVGTRYKILNSIYLLFSLSLENNSENFKK